MTDDAGRCRECRRSLGLIPDDEIERVRLSHGFGGGANDELVELCGVVCKARFTDADAVLLATKQATLAGFAGGAFDRESPDADTIAWGK